MRRFYRPNPMEWNLSLEGDHKMAYLFHTDSRNGFNRLVVARFKYAKPMANAKHFKDFLEKNFTPIEYFNMRDTLPVPKNTPMGVMRFKDYKNLNELEIEADPAAWHSPERKVVYA